MFYYRYVTVRNSLASNIFVTRNILARRKRTRRRGRLARQGNSGHQARYRNGSVTIDMPEFGPGSSNSESEGSESFLPDEKVLPVEQWLRDTGPACSTPATVKDSLPPPNESFTQ